MLGRIGVWPEWLFGREGEPDPAGLVPDPAGQAPEGDEDADAGDEKIPPGLAKLRRENQQLRARAKAAEEKALGYETAQMTELEKAKQAAALAEAEAAKLREAVKQDRILNAIRSKAAGANFHDPEDATRLIDLADIEVGEDGKPDGRSVKAAIDRLVKERPHLVKQPSPGGGDGGPTGQPKPPTFDDRVRSRVDELLNQPGSGLVRRPTI
jgi:hypothetical protein